MALYADILNNAAKKWGCPDMLESAKTGIKKFPFSSPQLNYCTYGGIPRGMITEFCGEEGGGKSTTAIDICHSAVKILEQEFDDKVNNYRTAIAQGKKEYAGPLEDLIDEGPRRVCYWDLEHSFDYKWAAKMGLVKGTLDVAQPPNVDAESILDVIEALVCSGHCGLLVLDSIPSLVPKTELEKKYGEATVAALANKLTRFMRKITPLCAKYDCALLLINQIRDSQDNPYEIKTPGGRAVKFYSSLRMYFRLGYPVDFAGNELKMSAENPAGYLVNTKVLKHKAGGFDRKVGSYFLMVESGIRPDFDYAKLAIDKYGIIRKSGGWYTLCDPVTGEVLEDNEGKVVKINGQVRVYEYLQQNPSYYESLRNFIDSDLNNSDPEFDVAEEGENE